MSDPDYFCACDLANEDDAAEAFTPAGLLQDVLSALAVAAFCFMAAAFMGAL